MEAGLNGVYMVITAGQKTLFLLFMCMAVLLSPLAAPAAELTVPDRYETVQKAVESARPGDTVVVRAGLYRENIVIAKPLTLKGAGISGEVVIEAARSSEPVITVRSAVGATVHGVSAIESDVAGIYIYDSRETKILESAFNGNRYGIHIEKSEGSFVEGNRTEDNEYGIYLTGSNDNVIKGNRADKNRDKGIILVDSSRNTLTENSATGNYWDGVNLFNSHGNSITDNKLWKNTFAMVIISSEENELSGNSKMRRLYLILPVFLVYLGIVIYLVERKLFYMFLSGPKHKKSKQMGSFGGG